MRLAWSLALAACSSRPAPPPEVVVHDAAHDAAIDAVPAPARAFRAHEIAIGSSYMCRVRDGRVTCAGRAPKVAAWTDVVGIAAAPSVLYGWTRDGGVRRSSGKPMELVEVVELAVDEDYACARHRAGGVTCWRGDKVSTFPIAADEIVVAGEYGCARTATEVTCWHEGGAPAPIPEARGAIDLGAATTYRGPSFVAALPGGVIVPWLMPSRTVVAAPQLPPDIARVTLSFYETCALGARLVCWQGEAPASMRTVPVDAIDVDRTCAQTVGGIACWGRAEGTVAVPVPVLGVTDAVELAASERATCARRANGKVACWGERLTDEPSKLQHVADLTATDVEGLADATDIEVARKNACARRADGKVLCWGSDDDGGLQARATEVPRYATTSVLATDSGGVCGIRDGALVCRGEQVFSQIALPASTSRVWSSVAFRIACGKLPSGVACFESIPGDDGEGSSPEPVTLGTELADVLDLHLGDDVCLVRASGVVECRVPDESAWRAVGIEDGVSLAPGASRDVCVLRRSGKVSCWSRHADPVEVPKLDGVVELVGGGAHSCGRKKSGQVVCWGDMNLVGAGPRANTDTPIVRAM